MTDTLIAGLLAGYGIAMQVGAISVLVITLASQVSLRVGLGAAMGVATADGLYAGVAVLGGATLAQVITPATTPLQVLSAAVLLCIAVWGIRGGVRAYQARVGTQRAGASGQSPPVPAARNLAAAQHRSPFRTFVAFVGLTMLNPTTVIYFVALVIGRQSDTDSASLAALFVVAAYAASISWQLVLAGGGAMLGRVLSSPRGRLSTVLLGNTVILALAAHLAWTATT